MHIDLNKSYRYEELMEIIYRMEQRYPDMLEVKYLWKSCDGREIPMLMLGNSKRCLVVTGGVHGRESVNPIVLLKIVEEYCKAWEKNDSFRGYPVKRMLEDCGICLLPLLNPDGYAIAMEGFDCIQNPRIRQAAKMRNENPIQWKYNGRGRDINRNFPCRSYVRKYAGDRPGSERETEALMEVFNHYHTIGYLDFHSRGKFIYYHRSAMSTPYNIRQRQLAEALAKGSGYALARPEEEVEIGDSGGNTVHYYSEKFCRPALTIETVEEEADFPLSPAHQSEAYEEICHMPLKFIKLEA